MNIKIAIALGLLCFLQSHVCNGSSKSRLEEFTDIEVMLLKKYPVSRQILAIFLQHKSYAERDRAEIKQALEKKDDIAENELKGMLNKLNHGLSYTRQLDSWADSMMKTFEFEKILNNNESQSLQKQINQRLVDQQKKQKAAADKREKK